MSGHSFPARQCLTLAFLWSFSPDVYALCRRHEDGALTGGEGFPNTILAATNPLAAPFTNSMTEASDIREYATPENVNEYSLHTTDYILIDVSPASDNFTRRVASFYQHTVPPRHKSSFKLPRIFILYCLFQYEYCNCSFFSINMVKVFSLCERSWMCGRVVKSPGEKVEHPTMR